MEWYEIAKDTYSVNPNSITPNCLEQLFDRARMNRVQIFEVWVNCRYDMIPQDFFDKRHELMAKNSGVVIRIVEKKSMKH